MNPSIPSRDLLETWKEEERIELVQTNERLQELANKAQDLWLKEEVLGALLIEFQESKAKYIPVAEASLAEFKKHYHEIQIEQEALLLRRGYLERLQEAIATAIEQF